MRWSCRMNSENFLRRRRSASGVVTLVSTILIFLSFERTFIEKKLRWCRKIIIVTRIRTLRRWYFNSRPFFSMTECWRNCLQYLQFFFGGWSIFRWWRGCCQWTWVRKDATETVTVVRVQMSVSIQLHRDHTRTLQIGHCTVVTQKSITVWITYLPVKDIQRLDTATPEFRPDIRILPFRLLKY